MTTIAILQYPDSRLHNQAKLVQNVTDKNIQKIIDDMLETLRQTPNCAGLAATQLDIADPPSITVLYLSDSDKNPICLINPEIIASSDESEASEEGCMSIYPQDISAPIKRAKSVTIKAIDRFGKPIEIEAKGFLAKCLQHEIDHLKGIIYLDLLSPLDRSRVEEEITKRRAKMTKGIMQSLI